MANFSTLLARPKSKSKDFNLDGDWSKALPVGAPEPEYPFLDQGDTTTVIFRQRMEQALTNYAPLDQTEQQLALDKAYFLGDVNMHDAGCGIVAFERLYAQLPPRRRVSESFVYGFQILAKGGTRVNSTPGAPDVPGELLSYEGPTYTLSELQLSVDTTLVYDYFIRGQESELPLKQRPCLVQFGNLTTQRGMGRLYLSGSCVCCQDDTMLAEDDSYQDWRGAIRCRRRRIMAGPKPAFWAGAFNHYS